MVIHLVDGTYELFRYFYSPGAEQDTGPVELRAVRGVVTSVLGMLEGGATHVSVATDHVIESFRNALWDGYKTGEGIDPLLHAQFAPLEDALAALGVVVWPMVEFEADDALATAAGMAAADPRVEQVVVCTPDKDLAQCVRGTRVVQQVRLTKEGKGGTLRGFHLTKEGKGGTLRGFPLTKEGKGGTLRGFPLTKEMRDEAGVVKKFGVPPASIP